MRLATFCLAGLTGVLLLAALARGDSWAGPTSGIYGCGSFGVKILLRSPAGRSPTAMLFTLKDDGSEELRWRKTIEYIPADVRVSQFGWVVGVNQYARLGYKHSLVIWNPKGKRLADFELEDLLTPDEIRAHVMQSSSSRWWKADFEFHHDGWKGTSDLLFVRVHDSMFRGDGSWQKLITVDLRTGKIWPGFDPESRCGYATREHAISTCSAQYSKPAATTEDQSAGDDFVRMYARQHVGIYGWELYLEADGAATVRIDWNATVGDGEWAEETEFKLSPEQMAQIKKTLRESDFASLPATLQGSRNETDLRSIVIETASGTRGMTLFSPNELTDKQGRKQAGRFIKSWLAIRDLFDSPKAVDERAAIRNFEP